MKQEYIDPRVVVSPQDAFYAEKESLPLMETAGGSAVSLSCAIRRNPDPGSRRGDHGGHFKLYRFMPRKKAAP